MRVLVLTWAFVLLTSLAGDAAEEPRSPQAQPVAAPAVSDTAADASFARDQFTLQSVVCPFHGSFAYEPGELSCFFLTVPENRETQSRRFLQLLVIKLNARKPKTWDAAARGEWRRREDPIVYLTGGPGAKAAPYVKRLKDHGARDVRDIYILEQRGVGSSGDFCPNYQNFDPSVANTPNLERYERSGLAAMEACFAGAKAAGVDLAAYSTIENARDVEALRRALRLETWNVWGVSYGSYLGQAYIKQDPKGIRAVVLDGVVPIKPGDHVLAIGAHFQRDLDLLEKLCTADAACRDDFPNLQARLKAAMVKVAKTPIDVAAIDSELFPTGRGWFNAAMVGGVPFSMFYEQKNYPYLPALIDGLSRQVETNNALPFRFLTAAFPPVIFDTSSGMSEATYCNDGWLGELRPVLEEDRRSNPELSLITGPYIPAFGSAALVDEQLAICARYGMQARPASEYAEVHSDIPTLIAAGQMDPVTPPSLAQSVVAGFSRGHYVEFPYAGHGPTRSVECAGAFVTAFFDNPTGTLDHSCADQMTPPAFAGPLYHAPGFSRLIALAAEGPSKVVLAGLSLLIPAIVLAIALLVLLLGPIIRRIDGVVAAQTNGARACAAASGLFGTVGVIGLAVAFVQTASISPVIFVGGVLGWAWWFAWLALLSGLLGLATVVLAVRSRLRHGIPPSVLSGLLLTGLAAIWLSIAIVANGLVGS